jgi:hypothetical protein
VAADPPRHGRRDRGLIVVLTVGSLLGLVLIVGGVAGLAVSMVPDVIDRIATFLSTGGVRRR